MLLEKAYAKLHGGYNNIAGGFADVALADLTGGTGYSLRLDDMHDQIEDGRLFQEICRFIENGSVLSCGSNAGSDTDVLGGVVQGHAYALLDARRVFDSKTGTWVCLLRLANPWYVEDAV
jgi:hypothetical protein